MKSASFSSVADLRAWLVLAPAGTMIDACHLCELLDASTAVPDASAPTADSPAPEATWRERLWVVPPETRIGAQEVAEALGRPVSWVYRHTSAKTGLPLLPHRKLDGLVFVVGEIRTWITDNEEIVAPGRMARAPLALSAGRGRHHA